MSGSEIEGIREELEPEGLVRLNEQLQDHTCGTRDRQGLQNPTMPGILLDRRLTIT
jgi:hypothetical protein